MNKLIIPVKEYNKTYPGSACYGSNGYQRQTGYVLLEFSGDDKLVTSKKWLPNKGQAIIERDTPGKYGERGVNF